MMKRWKIVIIIIGVALCIIGSQFEVSTEPRVWTLIDDKVWKFNGTNKVEAKFVSKGNGIVSIKLNSGEIVRNCSCI